MFFLPHAQLLLRHASLYLYWDSISHRLPADPPSTEANRPSGSLVLLLPLSVEGHTSSAYLTEWGRELAVHNCTQLPKLVSQAYILCNSGSLLGLILANREMSVDILVVTTWGGDYWLLLGRGQGCCQTPSTMLHWTRICHPKICPFGIRIIWS